MRKTPKLGKEKPKRSKQYYLEIIYIYRMGTVHVLIRMENFAMQGHQVEYLKGKLGSGMKLA